MPRENDPSYVRLTRRMSRGIVADVGGTGWSISGLDVKPFPDDDDKDEQKYVRRLVNNGTLEPCSKAEYEEVHPEASEDDSDDDGAAGFVAAVERVLGGGGRRKGGIQEAQVQKRIQREHAALSAKRDEEQDEEEDDDDGEIIRESDSDRRARLIEAQREAGLDTDDPEEQVGAKRGKAVKPKKASGKAKKAAQKTEDEE